MAVRVALVVATFGVLAPSGAPLAGESRLERSMGHRSRPAAAATKARATGRSRAAGRASRAPDTPPLTWRDIAAHSAGTYIDQTLAERNSLLTRWPARVAVRVWVDSQPSLVGWQPRFPALVRDAFDDWSRAGIPLRFTFVSHPDSAEVRVTWTDSLPSAASGVTDWHADGEGWLFAGQITLAMRASDLTTQDARGIKAIALHEVGHLLGLGHSRSEQDIMASWVLADELSESDRATLRLLYALPPGRVR
jgi:hypothetical protein